MKKIITLVFCIAIFLLIQSANTIQAQWVQTNGPYGGIVHCFTHIGTTLFAGTPSGGVYISSNNGTSWKAINVGLTNIGVTALAVSGTKIFAGTYSGGVFSSTNNGASWVFSGLANKDIITFAQSGTNLFAGTYGGGAFRSTDNGATWTAINSGLTDSIIYALTVSGTNLFAGSYRKGIFLSTDNGASWKTVNKGLNNTFIYALLASGANLYAATGGGVYRSTDNGTSWTAINNGFIGNASGGVFAFAVNGANLFAGSFGDGVFLSTNNGTNWSVVDTGLVSFQSHYILSLEVMGSSIFAATNDGAYRSTDNGGNWEEINIGMANTYIPVLLAENPSTPPRLFAEATTGLFVSTSNGTSWESIGGFPRDFGFSDIVQVGQASAPKLIGSAERILRSVDNGVSWSPANVGIINITYGYSNYVDRLFTSGDSIFASSRGIPSFLYLSTDEGDSWSIIDSIGLNDPNCFVFSGSNLFEGESIHGAHLSTDNGITWKQVNNGMFKGDSVDIHALASIGLNVFAGTANHGVYKTTNNGANWRAANSGLLDSNIVSFAVHGTNLFVGTASQGIFLSTNYGTDWVNVGQGLRTNAYISTMTISGADLIAGTGSAAVWRRPLSEMITGNDVSPETLSSFALEQNNPNPFSTSTRIHYSLRDHEHVRITLSNILGEKLATLLDKDVEAGAHDLTVNAKDIPSGMYVVTIFTDGITKTQKISVQK